MSFLSGVLVRSVLSGVGVRGGAAAGLLQRRSISILTPPTSFDSHPDRTVAEVVQNLTECVIGGPKTYDPDLFNKQREALMSQLPKSQDELPGRRMLDSYDEAVIPLGTDAKLRDRYLTHFGGVRVGRLLEDMDVFAVHLVFKHMSNPRQDPNSVIKSALLTCSECTRKYTYSLYQL